MARSRAGQSLLLHQTLAKLLQRLYARKFTGECQLQVGCRANPVMGVQILLQHPRNTWTNQVSRIAGIARGTPFTTEVEARMFGEVVRETRGYLSCERCFLAFRSRYVYPASTSSLRLVEVPERFDGAYVLCAEMETLFDPAHPELGYNRFRNSPLFQQFQEEAQRAGSG